jgi:uncharacterized protein with NRDE domain
VCFLTNFRNPANDNQPGKKYSSRGFLVIDFVKVNDPDIKDKNFHSLEDYEKNLMSIETRGYNIIYGNVHTGLFKYYQYHNNPDGVRHMIKPLILERGYVYGMSNGSLDEWDKVERGKAIFQDLIEKAEEHEESKSAVPVGELMEMSLAKDLF